MPRRSGCPIAYPSPRDSDTGPDPAPGLAASDATRKHSRLGVFRHREFTLYWTSGLLSNTGTWLQNVTAGVHIYVLTGSALMVGLLSAATFLPILLFGLLGGVVSDRMDRRRIIVVANAASMATTGVLTLLAALGLVTPLILIANAFFVNTAWAFAKPALVTMLPTLVERDELVDATATNSLQYTLGQLLGPLLSAMVLAVASPAAAYGLNALTFLGPIVAMLTIRPVPAPAASDGDASPVTALREGFRYVRSQPVIAALLLGVAFTSALPEAVRTLSPVYAVELLGGNEATAGLIVGGHSGGAAVVLILIPFLRRRLSDGRLVRLGAITQGLGIGLLAIAPALEVAVLASMFAGVGFATVFTSLTARLLSMSSDEMRGRVMSIHTVANLGLRPATSMFAGLAATIIDPRLAMAAFLAAVPLTLWAIRHGDAHSTEHHDRLFRAASGTAVDSEV